jgi:Bifunctional DNA primase/polymerase, N-terminal/Primase C terminal 1 (PriCT-1)
MRHRMLKAALSFAKAGIPVFPIHSVGKDGCSCGISECSAPGKHPRTNHGFKDATTDRAQVRAWWNAWPSANIGIPTGSATDLVVLDIDHRHGGDKSLLALERRYDRVGEPTVQSGGGGQHFYLHSSDPDIRSKADVARGIDVRANGGYIVAPPSMHVSGQRYRWLRGTSPNLAMLPRIPKWLRNFLVKKQTKTTERPEQTSTTRIADGKRNVTLTSIAGAMRRFGATRGTILAALRKENRKRCEPPLDDEEVKKIARSIGRYPSLNEEDKTGSVATQIVALAKDIKLVHDAELHVFALIEIDEHREVWALRSTQFKRLLASRFYNEGGTAPSSSALNDALGVLEGRGYFESPEVKVFTRLALKEGEIWLDLCDDLWRAVQIGKHGWEIILNPPVLFRRPRGMKRLRPPKRGGSIDELRQFLNVSSEDDFVLIVSWLVASLTFKGPFPGLVLQGEAGSAKSTLARTLRSLVDPNSAPLRSTPREVRDLMIAAQNGWMIAFDNVSHLPEWLSDAMCRLATGGGFSTRQLYTDDEEKIFEAQRPILLNGIEGVATRGDLLDRCIVLYLPPIPNTQRKSEKQFWKLFRRRSPSILGALLSAVARALKTLPSINLSSHPRMADFARLATAVEGAFGWSEGTFMRAYESNRQSTNALSLEASPLVSPIRKLLSRRPFWDGTATELLQVLSRFAEEVEREQREWPRNGQVLSIHLRRIAPNLRSSGIDIRIGLKTGGSRSKRLIHIKRCALETRDKEGFTPGPYPKGISRFPRLRDACDASDARKHEKGDLASSASEASHIGDERE